MQKEYSEGHSVELHTMKKDHNEEHIVELHTMKKIIVKNILGNYIQCTYNAQRRHNNV